MGSVGLPLSVGFDSTGHDVVGYDVDPQRVEQLRKGTDPTGDVGDQVVADSTVEYTTDEAAIERSEYILVAVPTPVDDLKNPNLKHVEGAARTIGRNIAEGATVVLESTVYPGATRELLQSTIEDVSGLRAGEEFFVGYSPERLVPGDDEHGLDNVVKVVSGQTDAVREDLTALYETVVDAGVHQAASIEAAEAAKCIENVQRDLNIALVNELAIACDSIGIDTHEVLAAARTKWNFHDYRPGLVGGHCIPVDPFFMIYESKRNGFSPQLIEQARDVNEYMPKHVADLTLKGLNDCGKVLRESTVLVLGLAYKPDVGEVHTSVVGDVIEELRSFDVDVVGYDPFADTQEVRDQFNIPSQDELSFAGIDAAVLATPHEELRAVEYADAAHEMSSEPLVVDVMGVLEADQLGSTDHLAYRRV